MALFLSDILCLSFGVCIFVGARVRCVSQFVFGCALEAGTPKICHDLVGARGHAAFQFSGLDSLGSFGLGLRLGDSVRVSVLRIINSGQPGQIAAECRRTRHGRCSRTDVVPRPVADNACMTIPWAPCVRNRGATSVTPVRTSHPVRPFDRPRGSNTRAWPTVWLPTNFLKNDRTRRNS